MTVHWRYASAVTMPTMRGERPATPSAAPASSDDHGRVHDGIGGDRERQQPSDEQRFVEVGVDGPVVSDERCGDEHVEPEVGVQDAPEHLEPGSGDGREPERIPGPSDADRG